MRKSSVRDLLRGRIRRSATRCQLKPCLEPLEARALLAVVSVNAAETVRAVNTQLLGVNLAWWDSDLNTTQTQQMVEAAGLTMFRFPGGSSSDDFHFNAPPTYTGEGTDSSMASFIASVNGQGLVTLDYGSGSPQEAAAFLAYLDAPVGNTTPIGMGQEWNDSANTWQQVNWQTAGYWASLRAAAPLATDDGLNFLRLDHPAPFGIQYFEVGNEEYGSWETDHHGQGGDTGKPHDPATYVAFAKQFAAYAAKIDPSISIGVDAGEPGRVTTTGSAGSSSSRPRRGSCPASSATTTMCRRRGARATRICCWIPSRIPTPSDPDNPYDWAIRAADYESLLQQYLGAAGKNVELLATEFNSVYSVPGSRRPAWSTASSWPIRSALAGDPL